MKQRLDKAIVVRGLAPTRSQAEHLVNLGEVRVNGQAATKAGQMVRDDDIISVAKRERYVSRAGLKLASVANKLGIQFDGAIVLDVGSSTGGFTDYALRHGAQRVIAIDVGTDQLHHSLHGHPQIDLHEKTDIRDLTLDNGRWMIGGKEVNIADIIVIDVSFISIRQVLEHLAAILPTVHRPTSTVKIIAMVKPQFEARRDQLTRSGIVKNDKYRRQILADFEAWAKQYFVIHDKADSEVTGTHGNRERFYRLSKRL